MTPPQAQRLASVLSEAPELREHVRGVCEQAFGALSATGLREAGEQLAVLRLGVHRLVVAWRGLFDPLSSDTVYLCAVLELSTEVDARGACRMSLQLRSMQPPPDGSSAATGECLLHVPLWATPGLPEDADFVTACDKVLEDMQACEFCREGDPRGLVDHFASQTQRHLVLL